MKGVFDWISDLQLLFMRKDVSSSWLVCGCFSLPQSVFGVGLNYMFLLCLWTRWDKCKLWNSFVFFLCGVSFQSVKVGSWGSFCLSEILNQILVVSLEFFWKMLSHCYIILCLLVLKLNTKLNMFRWEHAVFFLPLGYFWKRQKKKENTCFYSEVCLVICLWVLKSHDGWFC